MKCFSASIFKRAVLFFTIVLFLTSPLLLLPPKAHAQGLVVYDPLNHIQNVITSASTLAEKIKTYSLDPLAWFVAKAAIQSIVNSTVNWINHGFHGSPAFITDLTHTLQAVGDVAANNFLGQLASNGAIHSPFQNQVASAVGQDYFRSTGSNGFFNQNPYTLNRTTSNDAAFLAGNLSAGGFDAWMAAAMHPANNPYGAQLLAQNALGAQVAGAQDQQKTELGWGNGFLSWKGSCPGSSGGVTPITPITAQAPVTLTGTTVNNTPLSLPPSPTLGAAAVLALSNGAPSTGGSNPFNLTSLGPPTSGGSTGGNSNPFNLTSLGGTGATSLSSNSNCFGSSIQTPGSVIMAGLNKSLGSGIDTLVSADQFNEIASALLNQLLNQVLGPSGLGGLTQPSPTRSGSTYFNQPSATSQAAATSNGLSASFSQTLSSQAAPLQTYQNQWSAIGGAAQNAKNALLSSTCYPDAASVLATVVQPVIDESVVKVSQASTALSALGKVKTELPPTTSTADTTAQLSQASTDYSALISSGTLPSASDVSIAEEQSIDTGTSTPPSLYTQMNQIAQAAQSCRAPGT
ncbi:hypothetical protein H0X32_03780 [Patescibacteria group bacterium]|nr:hypothetical protein [Patescibacteria group bacterium]